MVSEPASPPRLFLITPPVADAAAFAPVLEAALAADVACVLLRTQARDEVEAKAILKRLVPIVQGHDAAALVEREARLAARVDADGVHVLGSGPALEEALAAMKPQRIVGCGDLASRDAAMTAGEAGVDYLMFGGPGPVPRDHGWIVEQVGWWAHIFNVPCVGFAGAPHLVGDIVRAGAEFVALGDSLWGAPEQVADMLAEVGRVCADMCPA